MFVFITPPPSPPPHVIQLSFLTLLLPHIGLSIVWTYLTRSKYTIYQHIVDDTPLSSLSIWDNHPNAGFPVRVAAERERIRRVSANASLDIRERWTERVKKTKQSDRLVLADKWPGPRCKYTHNQAVDLLRRHFVQPCNTAAETNTRSLSNLPRCTVSTKVSAGSWRRPSVIGRRLANQRGLNAPGSHP